MTATIGNFYSGTSDWARNQSKSRFYRTLTGSTASTELAGELPDFPSLSMLPPRNGEQGTPLRGVYAPRRRRPILFSQEVEFQMADLPRRKRHIAITPRMLASEENDAGREEH